MTKTDKPCKTFSSCQTPEKATSVCLHCGWSRIEHPPIRSLKVDGVAYKYSGRIEGHVIYVDSDKNYYTFKAGKLRKSAHIKSIVARGW